MEDYLIREIDKIGELLMHVARRLGLVGEESPKYSVEDVKAEFGKAGLPLELDAVLREPNPVRYLVETVQLSDLGLESFIDIVFHSDLDEPVKQALLADALAWLDSKGYYSFRLHSLQG